MKTFHQLLLNTLLALTTNNFVWFAMIFWVYLETRSVLATAVMGGSFMLMSAFSGLFFGHLVDHHKKKTVMMVSSLISLAGFSLATILYFAVSKAALLDLADIWFWLFVFFILGGAVAGNLRSIAIATTVTLLVPADRRDKANGMVGTVNGVTFAITSVFSGLAIGFVGMDWSLGASVFMTLVAIAHLTTVKLEEKRVAAADGSEPVTELDLKGTLKVIRSVPGLMALIFFATFNNFLGGVFMSLMDAYGLSLVSVETWGMIWGFISFGFIAGGLYVARRGLGKSPLRTLFIVNIIMWIVCILFPLKSSIIILTIGMLVYLTLIPVVEAAEQTIIQSVVPYERQGRVFGFAQSIESAASPITAFLIGPIAQFWVIPFMSAGGVGAAWIGGWFGVGPERGMALLFVVAGIIGLCVTLLAKASRSYKILSSYKVKPVKHIEPTQEPII
ncbi:MAG TPA: MFS transporter [Magnetospirillaceae bacterium]|nr:MFS transporter [Magnetospirillaceae bacterium]